ncbi:uncharacterized protein LOC129903176 [Solanum dulcamara]|uniref:uncharacterized protein LOC129903176 n=1 Tax=Solanum dulcamara TaxID=45834 RepID=UPI002484F04D|nr:uncharacterized protein LOC129903176 [Solanum dulcamara]
MIHSPPLFWLPLIGSKFNPLLLSPAGSSKEKKKRGGEREIRNMDEQEFRRLLELFPAVRSPDYYLDLDASSQSTSQSKQKEEVKQLQDGQNKGGVVESNTRAMGHGEAFWAKLKATAEKKMNPAEAEEFCKNFRQVYWKLVDEELSLEAARSLLRS